MCKKMIGISEQIGAIRRVAMKRELRKEGYSHLVNKDMLTKDLEKLYKKKLKKNPITYYMARQKALKTRNFRSS